MSTPKRKSARLQQISNGSAASTRDDGRKDVVVLVTKDASKAIYDCGYSCHGCGVKDDNFAVGTLNKGDRLNLYCIECFGMRFTEFNMGHCVHAPRDVIRYVNFDLRMNWARNKFEDTNEHKESNHGAWWALAKMEHRGCRDPSLCKKCKEINNCLRTWIPEVEPWYKKRTEDNGGAGGDLMEEPVASPSCVTESAGENSKCPGTEDSDKTIPYTIPYNRMSV